MTHRHIVAYSPLTARAPDTYCTVLYVISFFFISSALPPGVCLGGTTKTEASIRTETRFCKATTFPLAVGGCTGVLPVEHIAWAHRVGLYGRISRADGIRQRHGLIFSLEIV